MEKIVARYFNVMAQSRVLNRELPNENQSDKHQTVTIDLWWSDWLRVSYTEAIKSAQKKKPKKQTRTI
jgi:hypothetical protein